MAIEDAKNFRAAIQESDSLKEEFKGVLEQATADGTDLFEDEGADLSSVIELGAKHGFHFTRDDLVAFVEDIELTEEELELVSGGLQGYTVGALEK